MNRRSQFPGVLDKESRSLAQNTTNVWLVQQHGHLNESVEGANLQLLLVPAAKRGGQFDPKYCSAGTSHHTAKFVFCLGQTGHILHSRKQESPPRLAAGAYVGAISAAHRAHITPAGAFVKQLRIRGGTARQEHVSPTEHEGTAPQARMIGSAPTIRMT
jgi:hypothetical protein